MANFRWIRLCLEGLSKGCHAAGRADGVPFRASEVSLAAKAGEPCPLGAVIFLKADLAEFGATLGFWGTGSKSFPCFLCNARSSKLIDFERWDAISHPFEERTWEDYLRHCAGAERWRTITKEQHFALRGILSYERRDGKGASLTAAYPALLLEKGDRLEPWDGCPDIAAFERLSSFPAEVLFWRSSDEGMSHHRNPIYSPEIGLLPGTSSALDWLHTLSLGVFQSWAALALHSLCRIDAWRTGCTDMNSRISLSVNIVSSDLLDFVRAENRRGRNLTEPGSLKPEQFGTYKKAKVLSQGWRDECVRGISDDSCASEVR